MAIRVKKAVLDALGGGYIQLAGGAFLAAHQSVGGAAGAYSLIRKGQTIDTGGTVLTSYTYGNMKFAEGSVLVSGNPNDVVVAYFDFSA